MLGAGNQNVFGHSSLTGRPASIGQIIGNRIKMRRRQIPMQPHGTIANMLGKSFAIHAAQSPRTVSEFGGNTYLGSSMTMPGVEKVEKF